MSEAKYVEATRTYDQRLGHLIEELGEGLHAAGKLLRWGPHSYDPTCGRCGGEAEAAVHWNHPDQQGHAFEVDGETNQEWLLRELEDIEEAIRRFRLAPVPR